MKKPVVSIVIPTLNSVSVLEACLVSISKQNYPKNKVEVIIADGGSTDGTIELAEKYGVKVIHNKLKTAETGKVLGVKRATGEYIALVDSDNILPTKEWITDMITPLQAHPEAVGSEPWEYTWRAKDGFITRYCALIGMNDPFVHFLGNYDRMNILTGRWTEVVREEKDMGDYLLVGFFSTYLPTIGANGAVFRASFLKKNIEGNYLFDIDILAKAIQEEGAIYFIKVKNGIIHTFCEDDIGKFVRKQRRRVRDFLYHYNKKGRVFDWHQMDILGKHPGKTLGFIFSCVTVFPLFVQAFRGYSRKKDLAWFFHPLACEITLWEYGWGRILSLFSTSELDRKDWSQ